MRLCRCESWYFFFSSRRRHTRWPRDWSSDVCSSDLPVETAVAEAGIGVDPAEVADEAGVILDQVFAAAGIDRPDKGGLAGVGVHGQKGRDGLHTEALSKLLAEMQVVARAHPEGRW